MLDHAEGHMGRMNPRDGFRSTLSRWGQPEETTPNPNIKSVEMALAHAIEDESEAAIGARSI